MKPGPAASATAVFAWPFRVNSRGLVLPFRAKRNGSARAARTRTFAAGHAAIPVLAPISDRLNFHHTHEGTAEAAGARVTEAQSDVRNALAGFGEQMAGCIESHLSEHFAVTGTFLSEMTLQ
jgi:hypothetical protein